MTTISSWERTDEVEPDVDWKAAYDNVVSRLTEVITDLQDANERLAAIEKHVDRSIQNLSSDVWDRYSFYTGMKTAYERVQGIIKEENE